MELRDRRWHRPARRRPGRFAVSRAYDRIAYYDHGTDFSDARTGAPGSDPFDPKASGWIRLPEPSAGLLSIVGIATLGVLGFGRRSIDGATEAEMSRPSDAMRA